MAEGRGRREEGKGTGFRTSAIRHLPSALLIRPLPSAICDLRSHERRQTIASIAAARPQWSRKVRAPQGTVAVKCSRLL